MMPAMGSDEQRPVFGRSPDGRPDWFWISSPHRLMRKADKSRLSPGVRTYQRVLWTMIVVGVIATITFFIVMLVLLRG
jgi:hypothetical protein